MYLILTLHRRFSSKVYSVLPGGDGGCDGRLPDLPWEGGRKKMVKTIMVMMMVMKLVKIVIVMGGASI